jgi:surface polysaccharide O-acyltransferase-like enzyme
LISGARDSGKKPRTILFGSATSGCATALTVLVIQLAFGPLLPLTHRPLTEMAAAVCLMALTQYFANTGLVAVCMSMRHNLPLWQMWSKNDLWSSVTYFAGAMVAGFIASRVAMVGVYLVLVAIPTVFILYFTYQRYLEDVRSNAARR